MNLGYQNPPPLQERPETEGDIAHNQSAEDVEAQAYVPEGYDSPDEFLKYAREEFQKDLDADKDNRENGLKDAYFVGIDQWDEKTRREREAAGRPCLTVNTLPQYIGQVVGDRRMNRTAIRMIPKEDADVELADIRAGLVRSIEAHSKAERVYDAALEDQVTSSIGNFRIALEYTNDDVFEQDIFIRQIANPFGVVWDRLALDPTGRDARHVFVQDIIPRSVYVERWGKDHPIPSALGEISGECGLYGSGWVGTDDVRITEFWQMKYRPTEIAMLADGSVREVSTLTPMHQIMTNAQGQELRRVVEKPYACMHLITGFDILEGPYELPIKRVPIIRVNGREIRVGEKRVRFGLVRWARDPAMMRNYWRSQAVETLAMAPKNQWLSEARSVKGREDDFREAHLTNDPLLIHNDGTPAPKRENGPTLPAAVLQEVTMNNQDIKDTTGLQDASLGIRSNEVSGKAIMARQQEGDVATVIYHDNLNMAIQEGGEVINELINVCYDTTRTLRVLGQDDKAKLIRVNDPMDPNSIDLGRGKFDVEVITGPSYTTQRMFAAEAMLEAMKVAPQLLEVAGDLLVEAQDWPKAHEIARRLKQVMPKELTKDPDEPPTQEELLQAQQAEQERQVQQTMAEEAAELETNKAQLELAKLDAEVKKMQADARAADANADKAESEAERAELELNAAQIETGGRILSTGGRPQEPTDQSQPPVGSSGAKSGRQSRRPKPRKK